MIKKKYFCNDKSINSTYKPKHVEYYVSNIAPKYIKNDKNSKRNRIQKKLESEIQHTFLND